MSELSDLQHRIQEAIDAAGFTMKDASLKAGLGETFVRDILRRDRQPSAANLAKLAGVLSVSVSWLLTGQDEGGASRAVPNASFPPRYHPFPTERGVPLMGQTATGPNGRFILNGQRISEIFTPPELEGVEGAYAVQVYGTSMEPKFEAGETVWLNPHKPVRRGNYVVAQILTDEENTFDSYLKQFISQTGSTLTLRQFNPDEGEEEFLTFPADQVFTVHKVVFAAFV